jgi:hypothetical protein
MALISRFRRKDLVVTYVGIWKSPDGYTANLTCRYRCNPDGPGWSVSGPLATEPWSLSTEEKALRQLKINFLKLPTYENRFFSKYRQKPGRAPKGTKCLAAS